MNSAEKKVTFLVMAENEIQRAAIVAEVANLVGRDLVEEAQNLRHLTEKVLAGGVDAIIMDFPIFDSSYLKSLTKLKAFSANISIVILAEKVAPDTLRTARKMRRVVVIERPFTTDVLSDFCTKLRRGDEIYQRAYPRYATKQQAFIHTLTAKQKPMGAILQNISQGGAFVVVDQKIDAKMIVKVTIPLDTIKKAHVVFAEVVRCSPQAGTGKFGLGLRFMDEHEAYNILDTKAR